MSDSPRLKYLRKKVRQLLRSDADATVHAEPSFDVHTPSGLVDEIKAKVADIKGKTSLDKPIGNSAMVGDSSDGKEDVATKSDAFFDRELDQYHHSAEELTAQERELRAKMSECRDGGDLLEDYQRYQQELRQVQQRQKDLAIGREQYIETRDRLVKWGATDDWVVAGSIVTVRYLDGHRETFVLTGRNTDTEYETVSYSSPLGLAVRRRKVGDRVSLPAGAPLVIDSIAPGFRRPTSPREEHQPSAESVDVSSANRQVPTAATAGEALAKQRCRDKAYRDGLYESRYYLNVRRINLFVDELRSQRHQNIPYVAPTFGGENARLLILMQDPGPKTQLNTPDGSGMLCLENSDLSAARQKFFLNEAAIDISEIVAWNAYPWPKPHPQTDSSNREAAEALRRFLQLTPYVEGVILYGRVAKNIWGLLKHLSPPAVAGIQTYPTFHTSERAVDPEQNSVARIAEIHTNLRMQYAAAAKQLHRS